MLGLVISGPRYEIVESDVTFYSSFTLPPGLSPMDVKVDWYKNYEHVQQFPYEDQFSLKLWDVDFPAAGKFYAIMTVISTGETVKSNEIDLEIGLEPIPIELDILSRTLIYADLGDTVALRPSCFIRPPYATKICRWYRDDVQISPDEDVDIIVDNRSVYGAYILKSTGTCDGAFISASDETEVEILPRESGYGKTCPIIYAHDLNANLPLGGGRNEAYMWIGWWVWDEIRDAVLHGEDWTKDIENSRFKYKCELQKVASLLVKYPQVEIQESRNGYILGREQLLP